MTNKQLPEDYEHVDHPPHYNAHPSQVECIDLAEVLSFNVGSAFKYVFRRDDKVNPVQDLEKAKWYLNRELDRLTTPWRQFVPSTVLRLTQIQVNPEMSEYHHDLASKVIVSESNLLVRGFYRAILSPSYLKNYSSSELPEALRYLDRLITSYQTKD